MRFGGVACAFCVALSATSPCLAQEAPPDRTVVLREGRIAHAAHRADDRIEYLFDAEAGRAYSIELEQNGLDVVLTVEGPSGDSRTYDSPLLRDEREIVLLDDARAGTYRIVVHSEEHSGAVGRHSIVISSLAPGTDPEPWRAMTEAAAANHRGGKQGWAEAVARYESAAALWNERGESRSYAQALFGAAAIEYWQRFDWERAAALASEAASLYSEIGEPVLSASALHLLAAALIEQATEARRTSPEGLPPAARALFDEALAIFRHARQVFEEHGDAYDAGLAINNLGLAYYYMGEYRRAVPLWQEAAAVFERLDEWSAELKALGNLAVVAAEEGHLIDAVAVLGRIVEILPTDRLHDYRAVTLDNLAATHYLLGNLDDALRIYAESLTLHRRIDDAKGEAQSLRGIGTTYFALGYLDLADEFLRSALPLVQQTGDGRAHAAVLRTLGNVAFLRDDHAAALEHHRAALAAATAPVDVAAVEVLIAKDLVALDRHSEALAIAAHARAAAERSGARLVVANALQQSGRAHVGLGRTDEAIGDLDRAKRVYQQLAVSAGEAEALGGLALAAESAGRLAEAVRYGDAALTMLESLRGRVADPELRAYYVAARRDYYEAQIERLMALHRAANGATDAHLRAAFEANERSRARMMVDLIHEAATDTRSAADDRLAARRASLIDRLAELRHRRDLLLASGQAETQGEIEALLEEMATTDNELRVLETTLRNATGVASAASTLSLGEIQAALDADSVLLQYALGDERSHAWLVTRDTIRVVELAGRGALESAARLAYEALADPRERRLAPRQLATRLETLADAIVAPVLPHVAGRRIVVASDGALQYVPLGVLPDPRRDDGRPLLRSFEIVAVPSMSALAARRTSPAATPKTLAVIADPVFGPDDPRLARNVTSLNVIASAEVADLEPRSVLLGTPLARLPFSGREAAAIAALVPAADRLVLTGVDANRESVTSADLRAYRFVHFATHGLIDSEYPALSGLALSSHDAQGAHRDGFLRLDDIRAMRLDADLVVLSACETALGREIRGEGLLGLTHAFMHAGARATVASLWQVPDRATAQLMSRFYDGMLRRGLRPADALRAAQLDVASERRWSDPYFWGAFVLMGDWR